MLVTKDRSTNNVEIRIPDNSIISSTDINRHYNKVSQKADTNGSVFVFKNNKPDKVLMTFDMYKEMQDYIEQLECFISVKQFEDKKDKKFYDAESVIGDYL